MGASIKNLPPPNFYEDASNSIFPTPRKEGEYEIRSSSDVYGKEQLEQRDKLDSWGKRLRRELGLETLPGFKAERLINRAPQEEYFDKMTEVAVEAELVKDKISATTMTLTAIGAVGQAFRNVIDESRKLRRSNSAMVGEMLSIPGKILKGELDLNSQANQESIVLNQLYHNKYAEYLQLAQVIMMSERKDWRSFRLSEMDRNYYAGNRHEWHFMGVALSGQYQSVAFSVGEMDRAMKEANMRMDGSNKREALNIMFGMTDWGAKNFKV